MKVDNIEALFKNIELISKEKNIIIDDIIISSPSFLKHHIFTEDSKGLHELRSLSKYIVSLCYGKLLYSNPPVKEFNIDTPVWPQILRKINKYNTSIKTHSENITVKNLLIQSAGYDNQNLLMSNYETVDPRYFLQRIANMSIDFVPGTKFVYSNAAYFLLSVFYQTIYGETLFEYAKKHIFSPLDIVEGKWKKFGDFSAGATGLSLRSDDFHKLARLAINDGRSNGVEIIPEKYIKEMLQGQIDVPNSYSSSYFRPVMYGYSFWCTNDSIKYISGANGQYLIIDKKNRICITILAQSCSIKPILEIIDYWIKSNEELNL